MSIISTIKAFFARRRKPCYLVIFDGDQVSLKMYRKFLNVKTSEVKHVWVQSAEYPPKIFWKPQENVECHIAPKMGKESADTLMSVLAGKELMENKNIKEVHIVSSDGDTIDMCYSLAMQYPHVTFFTLHSSNRPMKKGTRSFMSILPSNCKFVLIKGK